MPDDLFKIDDPLADTEEDASIDEPNGVPSLASPSVKRPAPLKVIEADPEFKALTPVQKRQVMYRWVNAMPEMQGLDEHSKQALINRAQSRFPDEPSGVPGGIGGTLGVRNFYEMTPSQSGNLTARGKISSFGGPFDKEDNGRTASGNTTFDKPNAHYVALPEAVRKQYNIPWNTPVTITNPKTGKSVTAPLWDHGPAGWTGRRIDVSPATLKALGANTDDTVEFSVGGNPTQQVRGVQSPKSAGKGSLPFTPSPPGFNVARDIFAPNTPTRQSAAPAPPSVDPALVKGQYDRFLNTDNPTANIPMATAVRLSSLPSEQRAADTQLLRMNPVTQAAILQKAHELAASKNWRMNTSMGPATPAEAKRFDLLKGDPKAIAEATAGEANRNILNAAMYYAGLPKAAVQNVLLGLTAGLFPETMSPEQKKNYAKLQRLPHIQQLQYLMAQPVGRELEPNQEAARQSAIDRKVYQGSIPVETLMAAGSGAAIDPLMWGAVGPKLAMRVLEGSAAKVGAKGVAKALASPVAQGAAHTATSAAFAAGSARGLFDPKLWEENPTEAFIQTLFTAAATLGAMHGGLQMRGALKDVGAQNRSYEDAMKRAIHSRTIPNEQMPSDVQSPGVNVQGSSVVPTMPGETTETQSGVPTPMPKEVTPNATVQAEQIQKTATPDVPVGETGQTRAGGGGGESQSDQLQGTPGKGQEATQVSQPEAVGVVSLNPRDIQIDPERFQFKVGASEKGTTGSLSSSSRWRPELAGTLLVWKDPSNGKTYVVNGHNRLSLANRSGASSVDARYINDIAPTPEIARRVGAIANIAEGRGTPIDAAKLFREEGVTPEGLIAEGVSMTEANARNGLALARLPEGLWRSVFRGEMPVERGVAIGESGLNQGQMMQLHQMVESAEKRGKRLTPGEVGELGKIIASAGEAEVTTSSLFGDETKSMGLAVEMARLASALKYKLSKDARLFGFVSRGERATELERGGNKIDIKNSKQLAQQSAQVGEIFDRLAYRSGPINNALRDAAARIAKGENPHGVQEYLYERTSTIVRDILSGKETERGAGHEVPPTEQPHTATDLFSESESAPYTPQSVETTTPSVEPVSISPKPVQKPSENVQVPTSGKVVTLQVEGETVTKALTPEQAKAWDDAETQYNQWVENTKSNPNLDPEMKANQLKRLGMMYAAEKRRISGVLTAKEQLAQEKRESTNYQGKSVTIEGKPATVIGNSFGKVKVRLADGTERLVLPEVVAKPSEPPKVEPVSPKPAPAKSKSVPAGRGNTWDVKNGTGDHAGDFQALVKAGDRWESAGHFSDYDRAIEAASDAAKRSSLKSKTPAAEKAPRAGTVIGTARYGAGSTTDWQIRVIKNAQGKYVLEASSGNGEFDSMHYGVADTYEGALKKLYDRDNGKFEPSDPYTKHQFEKFAEHEARMAEDEATYKRKQQEEKEAQAARVREFYQEINAKVAALKGKKQTIALSGPTGEKAIEVPATVYGDLAIHKGVNRKAYTVTHVPSGFELVGTDDMATARRVVAGVSHLDWKWTNQSEMPAETRSGAKRLIPPILKGEAPEPHPVAPKVEPPPAKELPTARESVKAFQEESRTGKAIEALDALEQAAKERLKKRNKGRLSSGIDPLDLADYALIGAAKLGKGIVRFPDWSAEMVRDLGEGVKPHLDALWEYSKRAYDNHIRPSLGENAPIPEENAPKTAEVQPKPRRVKEPEGMEGVTGVAKVVTGRKPQKGITKQELFEMGRDAVVSNRIDPKKVADRTLQSGKPMSDEELAAIGYQLRKIEDARDAIVGEIDKTKDPAALADLDSLLAHHDAESNHLLDAADLTLNKGFHRLGMAAQIALDKTHSLRTLPQRAKAALLGTEAPSGMEEKLKSFMNENSKLQSDLKKVREELAQAYEDKKATTPKPRSERQRNADIKRLQQYFGKTQGEIIEPTKRMGRTAGAVRYTLPDADRAAMAAMRRLAADLAPTAKDFPDLLDQIRKAIGSSIPDEQIYRMLSEPYRKFMIEADLNRMKANQYVQQIKRQSEFELKTKAQKALTLVGSTVNTAQRSLQAGMDVSAPFIQGRKGLFANLPGWIKSWSPMIESLYRGEDVPMRQMAAIENHPMYSRAKAAGLDLTEVGGKFSQQEEMFAGNLIELLHDKLPGTNKTNPIKLYLQGLKNSEAAYTAFLNGIRWDTFVKLAKVDPENPAYLRDVASAINTIYGRGAGRTAKALGSTSLAGNLMFAPRNLMASLEYAGGRPVLFAETSAGRKQAMKIYAAQAASYGTLVVLAWLAGWNVGLDPRSSDFGKVEIGGAKYDLFAKEAQAYRLLTQILYGRVGETGRFTPPKGHTGEFIGNFLVNKAAPSPKLAYEFFEGKLVKKPNGGFDSRPLEMRDLAWGLTPFWVSKAAEDGTFSQMPAILLPNIAGEDVEPGTVSQKSVKADWMKPGIFMPKSNAATEARLRRSVNSAGKTR